MKVNHITHTVTHNLKTALLGFALIALPALADSTYTAGNYKVDPVHSKVGFEIPHLVISSVEGTFKNSDGVISLNEKFEKSSVKVSTDIASINTDNDKRDDHLKSADFFDAKKYPKMKFESTAVQGTPASFKLIGLLTIKNTSKSVTFDAKYLGTVKDGYGQQKAVFQATTKISRKDFGLTWNNVVEAGPVVGDEVTINLKIQAVQDIKK